MIGWTQAAQAANQTCLQLLARAERFNRHDGAVEERRFSFDTSCTPRSDNRARAARQIEDRDAPALARNQALQMAQRRVGDLLRGARTEDVEVNVVQDLQPTVVLAQRLTGALAFRDVALNAEMPGDAALFVVKAEVVALDPDRRPVDPPFVGLDVQSPAIEELTPDAAAMGEIMA